MKMHLAAACALLLSSRLHAAWTLNEVSVLVPRPTRAEFNQMIKPMDLGLGGELLPQAYYAELPRLLMGAKPAQIYTEQLRVVGFRIDPCFQEGPAPKACRKQLRLIWQPLEFSRNANHAAALDAAMHSFYDIQDDRWSQFLADWQSAVRAPGSKNLGIHPTLQAEGLDGRTWSSLKEVVLKYVGQNNLMRITAMNVDPIGSLWVFTGIDIKDGIPVRIPIPRVDRGAQGFFIDPTKLLEFKASMNPYPEDQIPYLRVLNDSSQMNDPNEILVALKQAARLENPRLENPGTVDCVSCHVAQTVRMWGERRGFSDLLNRDLKEWIYPISATSDDAQTGFVNRLRAFGYFLDETNISRRTLNESLEVVESLNSQGR